ncbi:MAG: hypothetical protein CM15mP78_04690 [Candidatus Poseidoniales archaeon]|nr:MAG: hypothetical protein CM15mP78_04690 [Candidatus Poseidoniales archaeon]
MKAVNVFVGMNQIRQCRFVHVVRKRRLHEDAVDVRAFVQRVNVFSEDRLCLIGSEAMWVERMPRRFAGFDFELT